MIKLFKYEGYTVTIEPEALMLLPFKSLWSRDKSKDKSKAKQELAVVYFMEDPRSDYQYIMDKESRLDSIIKGEGLPDNWKPDKEVKRAMEFYSSFKPASAGLLEDIKIFIDKFRKKIRDIDLDELEIKELKNIEDIIKEIPKIVKDLDEAERSLAKDIASSTKARGSQTKSLYEDED